MMKRLVVDIHTHTISSGHAYGTIRENALAAREKGLAGMGVTDHAPGMPGTCDPINFLGLYVVPRELYGVNIYFGVENNVLSDGSMTLPEDVLQSLDYGIVGIHGTCYENQGIKKNTDNLIRCMEHPKIFFISHPDDGAFPLDYERLVPAAKENGVALEVNNATIREGYKENCIENIRAYLSLCMKYKTNIYVGSDAHDPSFISEFSCAERLLEEMGFDEELIINNSEEKFRQFIGFEAKKSRGSSLYGYNRR